MSIEIASEHTRHTKGTPDFDIGQEVYCNDPNFPGPWIIESQMPWIEFQKGEWRYMCGRPDGWKGKLHVRFQNGRATVKSSIPLQMWAFERELYRRVTRVGPGMLRGGRLPGRRSSGGIFLP